MSSIETQQKVQEPGGYQPTNQPGPGVLDSFDRSGSIEKWFRPEVFIEHPGGGRSDTSGGDRQDRGGGGTGETRRQGGGGEGERWGGRETHGE